MFFLLNFFSIPLYYLVIKYLTNSKDQTIRLFSFFTTLHLVLFRILFHPNNTVDITSYIDIFNSIAEMSMDEAVFSFNFYSQLGHLFVILNWILSRFTEDIVVLFVLVGIVSVVGVLWFYKKTSYTLLTSIIIYIFHPLLYYMGFGVIRQHLAVVFVLLSIYYIRKTWITITFLFIASGFHPSAFVIFPYLFIRNYISKNLFNSKNVVILLTLFILTKLAFSFVLSFFPRFEELYEYAGKENNIVPVFQMGSLLFLFYITKISQKIDDTQDLEIVCFLFYGFLLSLIIIGVPGGGRITIYNLHVLPVAVSLLYKYCPKEKKLSNLYVMTLFLIFAIQYWLVYESDGRMFPSYIFVWESFNL